MECKQTGFTLIELLVGLAVLGIVVALATPTLASALQRTTSAITHRALVDSIMTARVDAITQGHPVTVCPSSDGMHCREDPVWDYGWLVYEDPGHSAQPANARAILARTEGPSRDLTIRSTAGRQQVRYQPSGMASGSNFSLYVCSRRDSHLLGSVIVSSAGRVRTEHSANASETCPYQP